MHRHEIPRIQVKRGPDRVGRKLVVRDLTRHGLAPTEAKVSACARQRLLRMDENRYDVCGHLGVLASRQSARESADELGRAPAYGSGRGSGLGTAV